MISEYSTVIIELVKAKYGDGNVIEYDKCWVIFNHDIGYGVVQIWFDNIFHIRLNGQFSESVKIMYSNNDFAELLFFWCDTIIAHDVPIMKVTLVERIKSGMV